MITEVKIQNDQGEALTGPVGRFDTFRLNAKFAIGKRGTVKAGDTTEVKIDSPIDIKSQDFEIKDQVITWLPRQKLMQLLVKLS